MSTDGGLKGPSKISISCIGGVSADKSLGLTLPLSQVFGDFPGGVSADRSIGLTLPPSKVFGDFRGGVCADLSLCLTLPLSQVFDDIPEGVFADRSKNPLFSLALSGFFGVLLHGENKVPTIDFAADNNLSNGDSASGEEDSEAGGLSDDSKSGRNGEILVPCDVRDSMTISNSSIICVFELRDYF
jgi:hypothetical protein